MTKVRKAVIPTGGFGTQFSPSTTAMLPVVDEPLAVMLGDDIVHTENTSCFKQMIDCYDEYQTSVLGVQTVKV